MKFIKLLITTYLVGTSLRFCFLMLEKGAFEIGLHLLFMVLWVVWHGRKSLMTQPELRSPLYRDRFIDFLS